MKTILKVIVRAGIVLAKAVAVVLLLLLLAIVATGVSPVYRFAKPQPFSGPDIFNPYADIAGHPMTLNSLADSAADSISADAAADSLTDSISAVAAADSINDSVSADSAADSITDSDSASASSAASVDDFNWKRANFHTHTRVEGIFNECDHSPQATYDSLRAFGYDIVTFSNHNELTVHPFDTALQVNVYEHGYNLFKYHKLVFGSDKVLRRDHIIPLFTFQKQQQLDLLARDCDFIQMNHPFRTNGTSKGEFERLTGYQIMELDSGRTTEQEYWDWALSAGHYSFALANDDLHHPDRSHCIARRCNFLYTPSGRYEDLKACLLGGCYYSMRVPDYGKGDWASKHEGNAHLPYVTGIGMTDGGHIYIDLSQPADSIRVTGQDHACLAKVCDASCLEYDIQPEDSYARFTAWFAGGEVIYSNAFARYDAALAVSPYAVAAHSVAIVPTFLYNLLLALVAILLCFAIFRIIVSRKARR